jgi:hypothetical protein
VDLGSLDVLGLYSGSIQLFHIISNHRFMRRIECERDPIFVDSLKISASLLEEIFEIERAGTLSSTIHYRDKRNTTNGGKFLTRGLMERMSARDPGP